MSTTAAKRVTRGNKRDIEKTSPVSGTMKANARTFYVENLATNAHKRTAEKARKELLTEMDTESVPSFQFTTQHDNKTVTLDVTVGAPSRSAIDIELLYKSVPLPEFLRCVSASAEAVKEVCGEIVVSKCSSSVAGNRNVTVKVAK